MWSLSMFVLTSLCTFVTVCFHLSLTMHMSSSANLSGFQGGAKPGVAGGFQVSFLSHGFSKYVLVCIYPVVLK